MSRLPRRVSSVVCCLLVFGICHAAELPSGKFVPNLAYKNDPALSAYETERCKLDLYLPAQPSGFPTLVWFYGGGMTTGFKEQKINGDIARTFARAGIAVALADYRLSPKAKFPGYVEDAAAAFAWVHENIAKYGGDPAKIFMGGHSAGAYLTSLVAMDPRYLHKLGLDQEAIAGLIPVSGQMMTHFTVRAERGIGANTIIADEAAPIYYARKDTPPFLILFGDYDWPARLEENQYFAAEEKSLGNPQVTLQIIKDRKHSTIVADIPNPGDPVAQAIIAFIKHISAQR